MAFDIFNPSTWLDWLKPKPPEDVAAPPVQDNSFYKYGYGAYPPTSVSTQPSTNDWLRTSQGQSPDAQALSGQIGGLQSTAKQVQPLAANLNPFPMPATPAPTQPKATDWVRPGAGTFEPVAAAWENWAPSTPAVTQPKPIAPPPAWAPQLDELGGQTGQSKSLVDTLGEWLSNVGKPGSILNPGMANAETTNAQPAVDQEVADAITKGLAMPTTANYKQPEWTPQQQQDYGYWGKLGATAAGTGIGANPVNPTTIKDRMAQIQSTDEFNKLNATQKAGVISSQLDQIALAAIKSNPAEFTNEPEILSLINEHMILQGKSSQPWLNALDDNNLAATLQRVAAADTPGIPTKLPTISPERLNAITPENKLAMAQLWDLGYKAPKIVQDTTSVINQVQNYIGSDKINFNPQQLEKLKYINIKGLMDQLTQTTAEEWQKIINNNGKMTLKIEQTGFDASGQPLYKGVWDTNYPEKTGMNISEQQKYLNDQQFYNNYYWSADAVAQRQKERDESNAYNTAKDNEGWGSFFSILDSKQMYPTMNDYYNNATMFNELRRRWQTTGQGQTWENWLANYDFNKDWYQRNPTARGERPWVFNSRIRRVSY